jgi:hypothetical protein
VISNYLTLVKGLVMFLYSKFFFDFEKLRDLCFFCIGRKLANLVKTKSGWSIFYTRLFSIECLPRIPSGGQDQKSSI